MRTTTFASPPRRVLVICIRRLGDVLLSTALIHSLRHAWPHARIEVLVNAASAPALVGNPDIDDVVVQPEKPGLWVLLRLVMRLLRSYDLAVCTLYNDRPHLYALVASSRRVTVVPPLTAPGARW
jgi:heptosyltransferase-3